MIRKWLERLEEWFWRKRLAARWNRSVVPNRVIPFERINYHGYAVQRDLNARSMNMVVEDELFLDARVLTEEMSDGFSRTVGH